MLKEKFNIQESFIYAWETFKKNWEMFVVINLINILLSSPQNRITHNYFKTTNPIIGLIFTVLSIITTIGILKVTLRVYDKEKPEILDIFRYTKYFWRYLGAMILYGLIVAGGLILLIVPGFIWGIRYSMTFNLIVDKDMGVSEAFRKSAEITKGFNWQLLLFYLTCLGVLILGGIAFGVGILIAMPLVWFAGVYVYRRLL